MKTKENSGSLRDLKAIRTREAIIATAMRLFETHGYEQVSIEGIMQELTVSTRTFYRYFPAKESVLFFSVTNQHAVETSLEDSSGVNLMTRIVYALAAEFGRNDPGRVASVYKLIQVTPGLQAKAFQLAWQDSDVISRAIQATLNKSVLEARIIAHTSTDIFRQAVAAWLQSKQSTSLKAECDIILETVATAFAD